MALLTNLSKLNVLKFDHAAPLATFVLPLYNFPSQPPHGASARFCLISTDQNATKPGFPLLVGAQIFLSFG